MVIEYTLEQALTTIKEDARRLLDAQLDGHIVIISAVGAVPRSMEKVQEGLPMESIRAHRILREYAGRRGPWMQKTER